MGQEQSIDLSGVPESKLAPGAYDVRLEHGGRWRTGAEETTDGSHPLLPFALRRRPQLSLAFWRNCNAPLDSCAFLSYTHYASLSAERAQH